MAFAHIAAAFLLGKMQGPVARKDFHIAISVVPGAYMKDMNTDLDQLQQIGDVLFLSAGQYKSFRKKSLDPLLEECNKRGLKVVLGYPSLALGDTTLEETAKQYGSNPAVIGFKVQDELGSRGQSEEYWIEFLTKAKEAIRKSSDKPILFDVIPWEFWYPTNKSYAEKYSGAKLSSIDKYVDMGLADGILVSVGPRIPEAVPQAVRRWSKKVKIWVRTSAGFKGKTYEDAKMTPADVALVTKRAEDTWRAGAVGIEYYAWNHQQYRILDEGGVENPAFKEMVKAWGSFRNP